MMSTEAHDTHIAGDPGGAGVSSSTAEQTQDVGVSSGHKQHLNERDKNIENGRPESGTFDSVHDMEGGANKVKLRRVAGGEYDVEKARKYFESEDFRQLVHRVSVERAKNGAGDKDVGDDAINSEPEEVDSDISGSSDDEADDPAYSDRGRGSYDFVNDTPDDEEYYDAEDGEDDGVSVDIEEGDSEFESENECSSISVTDSASEYGEDDEIQNIDNLNADIEDDQSADNDAALVSQSSRKQEERDLSEQQCVVPGDQVDMKAKDTLGTADPQLLNKQVHPIPPPRASASTRNTQSVTPEDGHASSNSEGNDSTSQGNNLQTTTTSEVKTIFDKNNGKPKRPDMLFDNSSSVGAGRKYDMTSQPVSGVKSPVLSPDAIDGYSLNLGWVDRVNKVLAEETQRKVPASHEDLIKHARECKIMKRYSEKVGSRLDKPTIATESLRRSPSDKLHDRSPRLSDTDHCACGLLPVSGHGYNVRPRTASYMKACTHQELNPQQAVHKNVTFEISKSLPPPDQGQVKSFIPVSNNSSGKSTFGTTAMNEQDSLAEPQQLRPRIPRRSAPSVPTTSSSDNNIPGVAKPGSVDFGSSDDPQLRVRDNGGHRDSGDGDQMFHSEDYPVGERSDSSQASSTHEEMGVMAEPETSDSVSGVTATRTSDVNPHGLIRKPAVRRKGYAWVSRSLPKNAGRDAKRARHRDNRQQRDQQGSSLELAPSLLNLYDDRIASRNQNKSSDEDADSLPDALVATSVSKSQSLPASANGTTTDAHRRSGKLPGQKLPAGRPVSMMENEPSEVKPGTTTADSKKRPLSISSMSSASSSSLPRLRKKRAATAPSASTRGSGQSSDGTIVGCESRENSVLVTESRQSVDSGCVEGDRNGDKYFDNMSITSSETGSFRDEVDSSSMRDYSVMSSSPSDKSQALLPAQSPSKSNSGSPSFPSPESKARKNGAAVAAHTGSPRSTGTGRQKRNAFSSVAENDSGVALDRSYRHKPSSPKVRHYNTVPSPQGSTSSTPDSTRRSAGASSRHEARKRFFSNYEERLKQASAATMDLQDTEAASAPHTQSSRKTYSGKSSPSSSPVPTAPTNSSFSSSPSATSANSVRRRDGASQLSSGTEKAPRRSERKSSSMKHDGQATSSSSSSQRFTFSRSSKKRDALNSGEAGNRSSPVYVSYVQRVVIEIIESERTYIASLEDIIHGYLGPLDELLSSTNAKTDIECLFSNIREIYDFGRIFLADLERTGADPVKVAECFVRHNKGFVIYTDYCTNYPRAVEVLTRFMQHPELSELCKKRQKALGHGLPLGAYLLKPVQRILKYHLLLQNIAKNYEKEGKETAILEQAFHHMTQMAHHINEMKRKHEHAVRIQEIQSQLEDYVGDDLTRLGELVLESTFRVYGAKASRQVCLFEKALLISKKKEGGMLSFKTLIKCSNLMLVEVIPKEPLSFHVIPFDNPRAQYTLQARNMEQKRKWCQEIKQLILESFKGRIPDNVKNLVMQLGREHDDDYVPKEALEATRKNQHTAPEYLEKRRFRRKSGSRMPDFSILKPQRARRGGNKMGEHKSGDKLSPERRQRAESKSPEGHRRLFSRQNNLAKRRAQSGSTSLPTTPNSDPSYSELFEQSKAEAKQIANQSASPDVKEINFNSPSPVTSTDSSTPVSMRKSRNRSFSETNEERKESPGVKRPASFLMARARPITSEDLTELVVRCGGSIKMASHQEGVEEEEEQVFPTSSDAQDTEHGYNYTRGSEADDSTDDDDVDNETVAGDNRHEESGSLIEDMVTEYIDGDDVSQSQSSVDVQGSPEINKTSGESDIKQRLEEPMRKELRSTSMPVLNNTDRVKGRVGDHDKETNEMNGEARMCSHSSDDVCDSVSATKAKGRMSRKDIQNYAKRKSKGVEGTENTSQGSKGDRKVPAFHDSYSKRTADKAVLRKKGLRLPNTSKHLSLQDQLSTTHSSGVKAKLTNWNSVEKLTKGSLTDLSHVNEDPWVVNPGAATSQSNSGLDDLDSHSSWPHLSDSQTLPSGRPRGHSDITDMARVSNKENLDWLVYLNRNSLVSSSNNSPVPARRVTSPLPDKYSMKKASSQIPYATPPRGFMTTENMKRFGSSKETDHGMKHTRYQNAAPGGSPASSINAFSSPSMTVTLTKPVSFNTVHLSRSNSSPITSKNNVIFGTTNRNRPVSMDVDRLTDESDRMVAEMEEYINKTSSAESIKSPNKFPTSLPTITIEDESVNPNRLSVVSSISTSSYESQGSSSSDGLVGTLKHKLHTWSQGSRTRNDSEYSQASTLTSDDEDKEEGPSLQSANSFEPPLKNRSSWKEERELETVLREHGLGSSKLGSRMAHSVPVHSEVITTHHCVDTPVHEGRPHSTCGLAAVESAPQVAEKILVVKESPPDHARFSLPPTTEATEALMPLTLKNCEIQQSDSGFSLQSNDSNMSDQTPGTNDTISQAVLELSEESSREVTPKIQPKMDKTIPPHENVFLDRRASCESIDSTDSFYERKLSVAFDSEVFQEQPVVVRVHEEPGTKGQVEVSAPRKSIREYVHDLEEKFRPQSPKVLEVKRREPGVIIRQRLENLWENAVRRSSQSPSRSSSRPCSEERDTLRAKSQPPSQQRRSLNFTLFKDNKINNDPKVNCLKLSWSRDNLSKSVENLSRSRESLSLSKSRESLNSETSFTKFSPVFSKKFGKAGHEKDANRFHYLVPKHSETSSSNQFVHRARSNSDQPASESDKGPNACVDGDSKPSSKSVCNLDQMSSEVENLVIMKGWVRSLIAKFQDS